MKLARTLAARSLHVAMLTLIAHLFAGGLLLTHEGDWVSGLILFGIGAVLIDDLRFIQP